MRDPRSASPDDPALDPLIERLTFLETINDGLKSRLSAGSFNAEMQSLALREQLESARSEVVRQQEALDSFCRETLAVGQARDRAQAAAEESLKACEAAVQERDALRRRLEALEVELGLARRGALDPEASRLVNDLEAKLELARRGALEAESSLRQSSRTAEAEAEERLRTLKTEFSEREALLLKTVEDDRRLLEATELKLESARRGAQEAENALRESQRKADAEAAERLRALAKEFADREAPLIKTAEKDRLLFEAMERELERTRLGAQETARAQYATHQKAQAEAEERLRTLAQAFAEREALLLKTGENERRRLAEMTVEIERARGGAQEAERASRESLQEAQTEAAERLRTLTAEFAEREAMLLKAAETERRRLEAMAVELEQARRGAQEAERALRDQRKSLQEAQSNAAESLRMLKASENHGPRLEALELELEQARCAAHETQRALRESSLKSLQKARAETAERLRALTSEFAVREALLSQEAERALHDSRQKSQQATDRLQTLMKEFSEREALLLKAAEDDRKLLGETKRELDAERSAARRPAELHMPQPVEGLLDPVWVKVLPTLRRPVAAAFARLRQLPLGAIPEGPRAMIRFAAVSLTQTSDMLKALGEFFDEDGSPGAPGRAEIPIEAAFAAWEGPFRQRKIAIVRRVESGLPQVLVREESLRVAVFQVLRNVYDAMPRGGTLTLQMSRDAASGGVCVRISDTGPGFSPQALATLFAPFAGARPGHLGLGLCLARRILRRVGGDVEAGNAAGRGAIVTLRLVPPDPAPIVEMET